MDSWRVDYAGSRPLFAALAAAGAAFARHDAWPDHDDYNALARRRDLRTASHLPVRFVPSAPKARRRRGEAKVAVTTPVYEERIFHHGEVSTRTACWHDFFNVLVWATYPRTKAALNRRQLEAQQGHGRCREQDRMAMLDEGGMLVAGGRRFTFGHALCEAAVRGETRIHALACPVDVDLRPDDHGDLPLAEQLRRVDFALAAWIAAGSLAADVRFGTMALTEFL